MDLESVDDAICCELLARYARAGVDVAVWDLASELRIPCFLCCLNDAASSSPMAALALGTGCHPSRSIALLRSLLKASELRIARRVAAPDEINVLGRKASAGQVVKLARLAFSSDTLPATRYLDTPTFESPSCEEDIAWLRQRFESSGVHVGVVDLSRPKYPVHVVRAVVETLGATLSDKASGV
jgi:ribosomal protein S12 methylthiotransferase accessory factor